MLLWDISELRVVVHLADVTEKETVDPPTIHAKVIQKTEDATITDTMVDLAITLIAMIHTITQVKDLILNLIMTLIVTLLILLMTNL